MIWPLLSGIPNQTATHMLWRGCVIFELLKAVNALGNVLFITNIQIFLWQKQILLQILKKILEKNWLWGEKVFCCGGKLFLNSSLKHLWEKITSAKHISFALRLARNEQKIWYHYLWSCFLFCYHWTLFSTLCSFLFRKLSIGKIKPQVSFSLGSFVSDKNALLLSFTYFGGSWLKAP